MSLKNAAGSKIIIAGAGPVGMCAALSLARAGIPSTLVDAKPRHSCQGSRAIVLDRQSLEHFSQIGCGKKFLLEGLVPTGRKTFFRGKELFSNIFPRPDDGSLPLCLNLPQTRTEQILLEAIEASGLVTIMWNSTVTDIKKCLTEVEVTVTSSSGMKSLKVLKCEYLLASDGCRSKIRSLCGLDFPGETNPYEFLIVDIEANLRRPHEHHFHFDHPTNPGHTLLVVPQPHNVWRIDWQLPLGTKADMRKEALSRRVKAVIGDGQPFNVSWSSCYKFHQRLMDQMSCGRIHFLGDAAHLVNPFGGRGMNSGVQDARCIAGKLIEVYRDGKPHSSVNSYSEERVRANREHQHVTRKTMRFIAPPHAPARLLRNVILQGSGPIRRLRKYVNSGRLSDASPRTTADFPKLH